MGTWELEDLRLEDLAPTAVCPEGAGGLLLLKDLLLILSPAILADGASELVSCGVLYSRYSFLTPVALPCTDSSSNVIDIVPSLMLSLQMLMAARLGFAKIPGY